MPATLIMTWQAVRLLPQARHKKWRDAAVAASSMDFEPLTVVGQFNGLSGASHSVRMSAKGVRRDKAALSSGCKAHPALRSRRKQSEQSWR